MNSEAYSIPEVIRRTSLCRDTIYKRINDGSLVARKAGKRTLITADDLNAFLQALPVVEKEKAAPSLPGAA